MLRSIRKRQKWVMVVGMSLLMVIFLVQGAMSQFAPDPRKRVVGTIGDEKIRFGDMTLAEAEYSLLQEEDLFRGHVRQMFGIESGLHWFLLVREAEKAGLIGGPEDGASWIPELVQSEVVFRFQMAYPGRDFRLIIQLFGDQMQAEIDAFRTRLETGKAQVAGRARLNTEEFDVALSKLRGVGRLISSYERAARLSDRRASMLAQQAYGSAQVDVVVISPSIVADTLPAPSEEDLQKHFEAYRAVRPFTEGMGFGYRQPPRIKLEWMTVDEALIAASITVDPVEANRVWRNDRTRYPGEFAAERPGIEAILRAAKVQEVLAQVERTVARRVTDALRGVPTDGPYRVLPADWATRAPTMESLADDVVDAVRTALNITIPRPAIERRTDRWLTVSDVTLLPGIGAGAVRIGPQTLSTAQLLNRIREIEPQAALDLQAGVPFTASPVVDAATGKHFFITVTEVRPEAPAESLADVRDQVVRDLSTLRGYEAIASRRDELTALAVSQGIDALAASFAKPATDVSPAIFPLPVTRGVLVRRNGTDGRVPAINTDDATKAIMDAADALDPLTKVEDQPAERRTVFIQSPMFQVHAVAVITGLQPVTQEMLRGINDSTLAQLNFLELRQTGATSAEGPFGFEAVKLRLRYKSKDDAAN